MALTIASSTSDNITLLTGTIAGGAGSTVSNQAVFTRSNVGGTTNFGSTPTTASQTGIAMDRYRIKVIRIVVYNATAADFVQLSDLAGTPNLMWETIITGANFTDQTNLGDEFRNGLSVTAKITTAVNGVAFRAYLYHGLS